MRARDFRDPLYGQLARIGKALASPKRLELLDLLAQGERSVEALARESRQPLANASHHLRVLREARLVEGRRRGVQVLHRIAGPDVLDLIRGIRSAAEKRLAEVELLLLHYMSARDHLEPVAREEVLQRARAGTVMVLDVRPPEEYHAGHIAGARSVPLPELERRLAELPSDREFVAYCRGPYCMMALDAVRILRATGRRARRLHEGFPEWQAAGMPVEVATPEAAG